jgi:hypothetical protein
MNQLYIQAKEKYAQAQETFSLQPSYDQIDSIFFITDSLQHENFVSEKILFTISRRMIDTFQSWNGYIHRLLVPNPGHLPEPQESQTLSEDKREVLQRLLQQIMYISGSNTLALLKSKEPAEVINESYRFWVEDFVPAMEPIVQDITIMWKNKDQEKKETKHSFNGVS